jgi:DMSO/TMAO reductase YedYZ molybdopterin-dependent catalytic subunit
MHCKWKFRGKHRKLICAPVLVIVALAGGSCERASEPDTQPEVSELRGDFPPFITPIESYFEYSIGHIPTLDSASYRLKITGALDNPGTFNLDELSKLEMEERILTIECIGNPVNGSLLGTARWKGFSLYELLRSLGIRDCARTVKYTSADGYYTYNTLPELKDAKVLGALYMNGEILPAKYGFPLRIIFPGYFGVRQPGWVVEVEVLESGPEDYWTETGWKTGSPMSIDSKIFFPYQNTTVPIGDSLRIGGAAFGARTIAAVDISLDNGRTWIPASIKEKLDADFTWVFWEVYIRPQVSGPMKIRSRATAGNGIIQPGEDSDVLDGFNSWPVLNLTVAEGD